MERSSTFTAIPGLGGVVMGVIALAAAAMAARQPTGDRWLLTWLGAAALAAVVGLIMMARKARVARVTLIGPHARRLRVSMAAPFVAGAAIAYVLCGVATFAVMVPAQPLLSGAGLMSGGQ